MESKEIIRTILENGLGNDQCGIVKLENEEDIVYCFGHPSCYSGILYGVEYLYYWPGGTENNIFPYYDANICINNDGVIENIFLMRIE